MFRFKKVVLCILTAFLVSQVINIPRISLSAFAEDMPVTQGDFIYGDVNGDGEINAIDFAKMRQYILGIISSFGTADGLKAADVDGNDEINAIDFALMRQYLLGMIAVFPANVQTTPTATSTQTQTTTPTVTPTETATTETPTVTPTPISIVANPGEDIVTFKSFSVLLDGSQSIVPEGKDVIFNWRIISKPSESKISLNSPKSANPDFVADVEGEYVIGLTVSVGRITSDEEVINVKVKGIESTKDDIDTSLISSGSLQGYDFSDYIPLSDGWIIVKDKTLNKVIFKNVLTGSHGKEFLLEGDPNKMEYDFERELLLVSLKDTNKIARIDMKTGEITYINIDGSITEMTLGERGVAFVYVGKNKSTVYVVDVVNSRVLNSLNVNGLFKFMVYDKNGNNLILGNEGISPSTLARYSFDEETNKLKFEQSSSDLGSNGKDLSISNDGKHVAYCCGSGNGLYTIYDIDSSDITNKFGEWNTGAYPISADFSLDNRYVVTSNGSDLKIFDVENHTEISKVGSTADFNDDVCFSRGGKIIYDFGGDTLKYYESGINQLEVTPPQVLTRPEASVVANKTFLKDFAIKLDGSSSDKGSGTYLAYNWEFVSKPENSLSVIKDAGSSMPYFIPDMKGLYSVSLSVYNDVGVSDKVSVDITVNDMLDTTDDLGEFEEGYLEGYLPIKPITLSSGWIIAADTKNVVKIVNVLTGDVVSEYQLSAAPNKLSYDAEGNRIVASLEAANKIAVIEIGKNSLYYIDTLQSFKGIVYGENNIAFAITASWPNGYIGVIDLEQKIVLNYIPVDVYGGGLIEYDKNNNNLFYADRGLSPSSLARWSFDENTKVLKVEQDIWNMGSNGIDMSISNDGKHLVFCTGSGNDSSNGNNYTIFDIDTTDISKKFGEFSTGAYPTSGAFSNDGKYFLASNRSNLLLFDALDYSLVKTMEHNSSVSDIDKVLFSRGDKIIFDVFGDRIYYYNNPLSSLAD
jgi:hypothetical protein